MTVPKNSFAASTGRFRSLFVAFFKIGVTSFGMPAILHNVRTYAVQKRLMTANEFDEGLGLVQLYPGPIMANLVTYIGYRQSGSAGALVTTVGFLLPSLVAMLAAVAAFQYYSKVAGAETLLWGLNAVVVGTVLSITLDYGKKYLGNAVETLLAILAAVIAISGMTLFWAIAAGFVAGAAMQRRDTHPLPVKPPTPLRWQRLAVPITVCLALLGIAAWSSMNRSTLGDITAEFMKIGAISFGNGYTILPMIQKAAVVRHGWLTTSQLGAAIGIGQFTPGPILNVATFTGFFAAGVTGALAASTAIYAPSFGMTLIFAESHRRFRHIDWIRGAIRGVLATFVGLLVMVLVRLGEHALTGPFAVAVAAGSFIALRYLKWSLPLIYILAGFAVFAWHTWARIRG